MLIIAIPVKSMKNKLGWINETPKKSNSIDTKKGFREREKIPFVTSLSWFFAFKPNRSDFLKWIKEIRSKSSDISIIPIPIIPINFELNKEETTFLGTIKNEKDKTGLSISNIKSRNIGV